MPQRERDAGGSNRPEPAERYAFVGRRREVGVLRAALQDAASGRGRLVLICGEAGSGKTSLATELANLAAKQGAQVLWGVCWEDGGAPAYWPWVQVIRSALLIAERSGFAADMWGGAARIAQIVPEAAAKLPPLAPPSDADLENARFQLFDAIATFLGNASAHSPLVVILDDLHAADNPSLLLLQFLARELHDRRVLMIGIYRGAEAARAPHVAKAVARLARDGETIALEGLDEREVASFIEGVAGEAAARRIASAVHEATEGNPFFVGELIRLLRSGGHLEDASARSLRSLKIPQNVAETIRHRLEPIAEDVKRVLSVAAVIGREFPVSLLDHACALGEERLDQVLEAAEAAGIIRKHSAIRHGFRHALLREALYQLLPPAQRLELHRRIAEGLEWLHEKNPEPYLAEIAHHFSRAGMSQLDRALEYSLRAGRRAAEMLAYEEAASHYERALEMSDQKPAVAADERCDLLLALGSALRRAGDTAKSKEAYLAAATTARDSGDSTRFAHAALGYGGGLEPADAFGSFGAVDDSLVDLLEEARAALPEEAVVLRVRVLSRLATALYWSKAEERRRASAEEAVRLAEQHGDGALRATALSAAYYALWRAESVEDRLRTTTEILRLSSTAGEQERMLQVHRWRLWNLLELGDVCAADAEIGAHGRLADELRHPVGQSHTLVFRALRAAMAGRFAEAEGLADEAFVLGQRVNNRVSAYLCHAQKAEIGSERGTFELLDWTGYFAAEAPTRIPIARCALPRTLFLLGRTEEARREFDKLTSSGFAGLPHDPTWLAAMMMLASACLLLADRQRAAELHKLLLPYDGRNIVVGPPPCYCYGPVTHHLGALASLAGRLDEAEHHFAAALEMSARMEAPPFTARSQYEYARMLIRRSDAGDVVKARQLLDSALAVAEALGMKPLAESARQLRTESFESTAEARVAEPRASGSPPEEATFRRERSGWEIAYRRRSCRLKASKGLEYLDRLLRQPGTQFHVLELVGGKTEDAVAGALRRRLEGLRAGLEEAERYNDAGRATRYREEIDRVAEEAAEAAGLGGRNAKAAAASERARQNIKKAIHGALRKIASHLPQIGHHLATSIRTGTFCSYVPDPRAPIRWRHLAFLVAFFTDTPEWLDWLDLFEETGTEFFL